MPKPRLKDEYTKLEGEIIETFLAGHHEWRPDLSYPESHSDMQGGARALLRMFDIKRRPVALDRGEIVHPKERCQGPCCAVSEPAQEVKAARPCSSFSGSWLGKRHAGPTPKAVGAKGQCPRCDEAACMCDWEICIDCRWSRDKHGTQEVVVSALDAQEPALEPNSYSAEIGASTERYPRGWAPDDEKRG